MTISFYTSYYIKNAIFLLTDGWCFCLIETLKVCLDARGLVGLFLLIALNVERDVFLLSHLSDERSKYLLEERILELVVFHPAIYGATPSHVFEQLHIPVDEFGIECLCEACLDDIELAVPLSQEHDRLEGFSLLPFRFTRSRVAVDNEELELG